MISSEPESWFGRNPTNSLRERGEQASTKSFKSIENPWNSSCFDVKCGGKCVFILCQKSFLLLYKSKLHGEKRNVRLKPRSGDIRVKSFSVHFSKAMYNFFRVCFKGVGTPPSSRGFFFIKKNLAFGNVWNLLDDLFCTVCCRESIVLIQFFFCDQIMFWSFEFFGL